MKPPPDICPVCGCTLPRRARVCPECGADDRTGWSDRARYDGLDLPDEEFDYGDFVRREFGGSRRLGPPRGVRWWWWLVAVGLVVVGLLIWFVP